MSRTCQYQDCERGCYGEFCLIHKPKKPIKTKTRIKKINTNTAKALLRLKIKWLRENPPDRDGFWNCYLNGLAPDCLGRVNTKTMNMEHVIPKVKAPGRKYDHTNIRAACQPCNRDKGSWTIDQLIERNPEWRGPLV